MDDGIIDIKKYKMKKRYFFRTIEILCFLLLSIFEFLDIHLSFLILLIISLFAAMENSNVLKPKNVLNRLKQSLVNSNIIKYGSEDIFSILMIEVGVCIILFIANNLVLRYIDYLLPNIIILAIEAVVILFFAIKNYVKFMKVDVFTDKANTQKQNLLGLANYLKNYSLIENRKSIEIHLWDNYLIISVLLDINKTIPKELNLSLSNKNRNIKTEIKFDYYENKYFYINDKNEKIYIE